MENESQLQTAEEYAFSVMELEKDGKFAVWEGGDSTDPISTLSSIMQKPEQTVRRYYETWLESPSASDKSQRAKSIARRRMGGGATSGSSLSSTNEPTMPNIAPINIPDIETVSTSDTISSTTKSVNDLVNFRRAQSDLRRMEREDAMNMQPRNSGDDEMKGFLQSLVLNMMGSNQKNNNDDALVVLKQMEVSERAQQQSRQDQQMFIQLMQAQQDRSMQLMFELMRGNGNRSTVEEKILSTALDRMLEPQEPSGNFVQDLMSTGALEQLGKGLGSAMSIMRQAPPGQNPYEVQQAQVQPQSQMQQYALMNPQMQPEQQMQQQQMQQQQMQQQQMQQQQMQQQQMQPQPQVAQEPSFQQKCEALMTQIQQSDLKHEGATEQQWATILANAIEIAVRRGEDTFPTNIQMQMEQAFSEIILIANLRTFGSAIQAINKGEVSIGLAANAIRGNELYQLFEHMNSQDLIETIAAYSDIDAQNLKIIQFDIDYIIRPEHQSIIEQVLLTAKQGA